MGKDKRMDAFARETFKLGTLSGFRHFKTELRGREEMILTIDVPSGSLGRLLLAPHDVSAHAAPPTSDSQDIRFSRVGGTFVGQSSSPCVGTAA